MTKAPYLCECKEKACPLREFMWRSSCREDGGDYWRCPPPAYYCFMSKRAAVEKIRKDGRIEVVGSFANSATFDPSQRPPDYCMVLKSENLAAVILGIEICPYWVNLEEPELVEGEILVKIGDFEW